MAKIYHALGEPNRLRILGLLASQDEMGCTELAERMALSRPTLSHHTNVLQECGLIDVRKEGKAHFMRVRRDELTRYAPAALGLGGTE